jgi:hypothetical protein
MSLKRTNKPRWKRWWDTVAEYMRTENEPPKGLYRQGYLWYDSKHHYPVEGDFSPRPRWQRLLIAIFVAVVILIGVLSHWL